MFEYLMPSLMLDEPQGSLLHGACDHAVGAQRAFGELQDVPRADLAICLRGAGQLHGLPVRAAGCACAGLAAYTCGRAGSSALCDPAGPYRDPQASIANLQRLELLGARREWGFMEALDYTPVRQTGMEPFTLVGTFMAHHQGMALASLTNLLHLDIVKRWGMADPHMEAVGSLLHERVPEEIRKAPGLAPVAIEQRLQLRPPGLVRQLLPGNTRWSPASCCPTDVTVLRCVQMARVPANGITQASPAFRDDALRDAYGSFVFCRELGHTPPATLLGSPAVPQLALPQARTSFQPDRVVFHCDALHWESRMTVWVSPEDDIEFRQVELHNTGDETLELELGCSLEIALNKQSADEAHPAFSKLFVHSEWLEAQRACCTVAHRVWRQSR